MSQDRKRAREATAKVLEQFYSAIGTPAPAPGIERLAFIAVEAAYLALREQWAEDLRDEEVDKAVAAALEQVGETWPLASWEAKAKIAIEAALLKVGARGLGE